VTRSLIRLIRLWGTALGATAMGGTDGLWGTALRGACALGRGCGGDVADQRHL
jgi:hypothetical protein